MKRTYCVFNQTGESFVGLNIRRSDNPLALLLGFVGRLRLRSGDGFWVVPSRGIHTMSLLAPVDLIYLDEGNRVIHLVEHLSSFRISAVWRKSTSVLVLPAHAIYSSQTHVGDQFLICLPDEIDGYLKKSAPALQVSQCGANGVMIGKGVKGETPN